MQLKLRLFPKPTQAQILSLQAPGWEDPQHHPPAPGLRSAHHPFQWEAPVAPGSRLFPPTSTRHLFQELGCLGQLSKQYLGFSLLQYSRHGRQLELSNQQCQGQGFHVGTLRRGYYHMKHPWLSFAQPQLSAPSSSPKPRGNPSGMCRESHKRCLRSRASLCLLLSFHFL